MMRYVRNLILIFSLAICGHIHAQTSLAANPINEDTVKYFVSVLSADSMQGRIVGTEGNMKAAEFIVSEFKKARLRPLAGNDGYYMPFDVGTKANAAVNVMGVLPGKSKPEEIIIFCAHYDHIGTVATNPYRDLPPNRARGEKGDTIFNGANDNASGVSGVLALMRYYARVDTNARTILFIAFSGEEMGLLGSRAMLKNLTDPANIKTVINIEMIGRGVGVKRVQPFITGDRYSDLRNLLNKELSRLNRSRFGKYYFLTDNSGEENLFRRSDNLPFAELGIPAHTIMAGSPADPLYHSVQDEAGTLNFNMMAEILDAIIISCQSLVNGTMTPSRINPSRID